MNAMEKVAWTELLVSLGTIVVVTAIYPWMGPASMSAFGLLGLLVCSLWFVKGRGQAVVIDERDREIERQATRRGIEAAWMALFLALIAIVLWSVYFNEKKAVSIGLLSWLIWIQFALCYAVKGLVAVIAYRRQGRAA